VSTDSDSDLSALSPLASELASTIARVASDIALVVDKDGVISAVAEGSAMQAHGCQQWVGQRWVDTVSASTRPKIQSLLDEVARSGVGSRRREVSHPAGSSLGGEELPVTWAAIRLGVDGPVLAVGRDLRAVAAIQQRFVEAQQDMERQYWNRRQAEARDRLLFQVINDGVLVLDALNLQVLQANAASAVLLGHGQETLHGRPLKDYLPSSAWMAVTELLSNARGTGRAGEIHVRGQAAGDGLDIFATPFRVDEQHQLLLRIRREERGEVDSESASRMAEFVMTTPDAVVITNTVGSILMVNPAFLRMTRLSDEQQLRSRALPDLLFDANGHWSRLIACVLREGLVTGASLDVGSPKGPPQTVQVTAALMTEGEQAALGFILRPGHRLPAHQAGADVLLGLLEQVGHVPLADLLVEVAQRAERQLIVSALLRTGGQCAAAADALGMSAEVLALRIQRHGLSAFGPAQGAEGSPVSIN